MKEGFVLVVFAVALVSGLLGYSKYMQTRREAVYRAAVAPFQHDLHAGTSRTDVEKYFHSHSVQYKLAPFYSSISISAPAPAQYGTDQATFPLKPSNPGTFFRFAMWAMSDYKGVPDTRCFEIQIPSEVFLAGLFISPHALFAKFPDEPLAHIVTETAGINEIVSWLRHVEGRAFKSDDRPDF